MSSVGEIGGAIVGGVVGFFIGGPAGALKGAFYGASIGGVLDPPEGPTVEGPRLDDRTVTLSGYGAPIDDTDGTINVAGTIIWVENNEIREVSRKQKQGGGKGGGGGQTVKTYEYYATFAVLLCEDEIDGVNRTWLGGELISNTASEDAATAIASRYRFINPTGSVRIVFPTGLTIELTNTQGSFQVYYGTDDQEPDPRMEADLGVGNCPAYRGRSYIVFYDWPLKDLGNTLQAAQLKAEVIKGGELDDVIELSRLEIDKPANYSTYISASYITPEETIIYGRRDVPGEDLIDGPRLLASLDSIRFTGTVSYDDSDTRFGAGSSDIDIGLLPTDPFGVPGSFADTSGRLFYKNGIWYGVYWLSAGGDTLYAGTNSLLTDNGAYAIAPDDNGNLWVIFETEIRKYDSELNLLKTVTKTFTGENYTTRAVRAHWDNDFLYIAFGANWIHTVYICDMESESYGGPYDIPTINDGQTTTNFSVVNGILTRVVPTTGGKIIVTRYRLPEFTPSSVDLSDIVSRRLQKSRLIEASDIDVSLLTATVRGYSSSGVNTIRSTIQPLQNAFPFDLISSGYQIKAVPRGQASSQTIDAAFLDARPFGQAANDRLPVQREVDNRLPRKVIVRHIDAAREYDINEQQSPERSSSDAVNVEEFNLPIVLQPSEGSSVAEVIWAARWQERRSVQFSLPPIYRNVEPADVITIVEDYASLDIRLDVVEYMPNGVIRCEGKITAASAYTASTSTVGGQGNVSDGTVPLGGASEMILLDMPLIRDADDIPGYGVAVSGRTASWPGGVVYKSSDNEQTYDLLQAFSAPVTMGLCLDSLPDHDAYVIDRESTLTVELFSTDMTLSSITVAQMMTGLHYCAYGVDGRWEIIRFANATLNADGTYTLDTFVRGAKGTEQYCGAHENFDKFVFLDDTDLAGVGADLQFLGVERPYKAVSQGKTLESVTAQLFAYNGINLKPLSPVFLSGSQSGTGWTLSWVRRSRYSTGWWNTGVERPVGETTEAYEIDILDGSTVIRTLTASSESVDYTNAQQIEDFSAIQSSVTFRVYQISSRVGRGYYSQETVTRANILGADHPNLIAFYNFESVSGGTLTDISGNGNNGTLSGSPTIVTGHIGSALQFNGSTDYVSISGYLPNDNCAVSWWMKIASSPSGDEDIFGRGGSGETVGTNLHMLRLLGSNGNFDVFTETGSGTNHDQDMGAGPSYDGAWHHYTYELVDGSVSIYEDGSLIAGPTAITISDTTSNLGKIARNSGGNNEHFTGTLDNMRFFNLPGFTSGQRTDLADET